MNLARAFQGAELESGDGELVLPSILNLQTEIGSPIDAFIALGPTIIARSSFVFGSEIVTGALAAAVTYNLPRLGIGIWNLDIFFASVLQGVNSVQSADVLQIKDPQANNVELMRLYRNNGGLSGGITGQANRKINLALSTDNFKLEMVVAATGAGDAVKTFFNIIANKIA